MNNNSLPGQQGATIEELQFMAGLAKFYGESDWSITISGFLVQGGKVSAPADGAVSVPFNQAFPKQVLTILLTGISTAAGNGNVGPGGSLSGFNLYNSGAARDYYWFAWGL